MNKSPQSLLPPKSAEFVLRRLLPANFAGLSVVGDLRQEYSDLARRVGISAANRWYWHTVFVLSARYNWIRFRTSMLIDRPTYGWAHRKTTMSDTLRDFRFGVRCLFRSPVFSLIVIVTLALGIGANTTIFSVVNSLLLRPLPYPEPEQLVTVNNIYPSVDMVSAISATTFRDFRDRTQSFQSVAITRGTSANLTGFGEPVRVKGSQVSADYFRVFGITPAIGRSFLAEEEAPGDERVVVISDGFWRLHLGVDPEVLEATVLLNHRSYRVIGVLPRDFEDFFNPDCEFWVPIALTPERYGEDYRFSDNYQAVARLKPTVTVATAGQEVANLAETIKSELSRSYPPEWTFRATSLHDRKTAGYRTTLLVLFGAVGFVLLIACANIANLLLARGIGRQKEIAIRKALGASRGQVIRYLLAEGAVLALCGGVAGLLLAYWGITALVAGGPALLARTEITIDVRVLLFTLGIAMVTGLLFGLVPAVLSSGGDLQSSLKEGGQASKADRSGHRLRHLLVVGEFAIAVLLLTGSGLMIRTISRLRQVDPGFNPSQIISASVLLPPSRYPDPPSRVAFYDQLLSELTATPGIRTAATTSVLPFGGGWNTLVFNIEGYVRQDGGPPLWGDTRIVSPSFVQTMEIPLLRGRFFDLTDGPLSQLVAVVDDEMVRRFWPDQDPIGKRITFHNPTDAAAQWMTVIGVVGHTLHDGLDDNIRIQVYRSTRQFAGFQATILLKTNADPEAMVSTLRRTVLSVDPSMPISDVRIMEVLISESFGNQRLFMLLLTLFAALAIFLASLGIYGIMSFTVRERYRELGIRLALGATRPSLFRLVITSGMSFAGVGVLLGVGGSLALTRLMQNQLFGVSAIDPPTLGVVVSILLAVALVAICLPASRAARTDPVENLRTE